jgi:hypothetical protein
MGGPKVANGVESGALAAGKLMTAYGTEEMID